MTPHATWLMGCPFVGSHRAFASSHRAFVKEVPFRLEAASFVVAVSETLRLYPPNVLGVSCTAGSACRSRSGTAVAANDVRRTESRTATAVTPSRWR